MHDIDEIRRKAMLLLEKEVGGPVAAAAKVGWSSYTQWVNLRSGARDSKTGKRRGMRKETARKIEEAFGKQAGWLDSADLTEENFPKNDSALELLTHAWSIADENERAVPLAWANATLAAHSKK